MRSSTLLWIIGAVSLLAFLFHIADPAPEKEASLIASFVADQSIYVVTSFACFFLAYVKMKEQATENRIQSICLWVVGSVILIDAGSGVLRLMRNGSASLPPSAALHLLIHLITALVFFFFAYSQGGEKDTDQEPQSNP